IATMAIGCGGEASTESEEGGEETEGAGEDIFISIATGGTAGAYYPIGGAMASEISNSLDNVSATAEATGASTENAGLIQDSESDLALLQNDIAYYASTATVIDAFDSVYDNLLGLAILYPEYIQIVASAGSGIKSVADLAGKDVAVGAPGSGTEANARQILNAYGLSFDDLGKADALSFAEASEGLQNGQIDAAFMTAAIPNAGITEVAQVRDVVIVPVEPDKVQSLIDEGYTFYTEQTIPAGTYKGQEEDINTTAVMAMLAVRGDLDEDVVYDITKAIFEGLEKIGQSHDMAKNIKLESALEGMPLDLHPGAKKYFDEVGVK
ncbi:MAG TPA: TAXI family TRAP transporter solute-binding subunit, partial [Tissierellaceae bacterium]|nr:TAXI family TRAP transporter solute-binding subunit [Tissierellaceae bacterium]